MKGEPTVELLVKHTLLHMYSRLCVGIQWLRRRVWKVIRLCQMLCFQSNTKKQQLKWSYSPFYSVCVYFLHVCIVRLFDSIPREATWEPLSPLIFETIQTPRSALSSEKERENMQPWLSYRGWIRTSEPIRILSTTKFSWDHWMIIFGKRKIIISIIFSWRGCVLAGFMVLFWTRIAHARSDL